MERTSTYKTKLVPQLTGVIDPKRMDVVRARSREIYRVTSVKAHEPLSVVPPPVPQEPVSTPPRKPPITRRPPDAPEPPAQDEDNSLEDLVTSDDAPIASTDPKAESAEKLTTPPILPPLLTTLVPDNRASLIMWLASKVLERGSNKLRPKTRPP